MIVTDERVARFVSERLNATFCPPYTVAGLERDGEIVAGVVFNQFEGPNVYVSAAGTGWTRGFIEAVGQYVFDQLGCLRMTVATEQEEVADYAERLGGVIEGRMRDYYGPGRNGILVGILRKDWKFGTHKT